MGGGGGGVGVGVGGRGFHTPLQLTIMNAVFLFGKVKCY